MGKILVGCEESQAVCRAFRALGHEAYSCDIIPCSGGHPEWHLQQDVSRNRRSNGRSVVKNNLTRYEKMTFTFTSVTTSIYTFPCLLVWQTESSREQLIYLREYLPSPHAQPGGTQTLSICDNHALPTCHRRTPSGGHVNSEQGSESACSRPLLSVFMIETGVTAYY